MASRQNGERTRVMIVEQDWDFGMKLADWLATHGYCPDCVAHFDARMAAYRPTTVWESLREAGRRLFAGTGGGRRDVERLFSFAEYPVACCGDEGEENPP